MLKFFLKTVPRLASKKQNQLALLKQVLTRFFFFCFFKTKKSSYPPTGSLFQKELIKRIQVIYLLVDYECFLKVDKQAVKFDLVESLDEDHKIMYSHYKGMYTVSDRDFVYFRAKTETSNQIVYGTFSVDTHPTESPKGVVRAWIHFSGWCIEIIDEPEKEKIKASNITPIEGKPWLRLTYTGSLISPHFVLYSLLFISIFTKLFFPPPQNLPSHLYSYSCVSDPFFLFL